MRWLGLFIAVLSMGFWPAAARAQSPADPFMEVLGRLDALERENRELRALVTQRSDKTAFRSASHVADPAYTAIGADETYVRSIIEDYLAERNAATKSLENI